MDEWESHVKNDTKLDWEALWREVNIVHYWFGITSDSSKVRLLGRGFRQLCATEVDFIRKELSVSKCCHLSDPQPHGACSLVPMRQGQCPWLAGPNIQNTSVCLLQKRQIMNRMRHHMHAALTDSLGDLRGLNPVLDSARELNALNLLLWMAIGL